MRRIAFAGIFFLLMACQNQDCPKYDPTITSPFEMYGKVLLDDPGTLTTQSLTNEILAGTEVTVVVDHSCKANQSSWNKLSLSRRFEGATGVISHEWIVDSNITIDELTDQAENDPCIVGISPLRIMQNYANDPALSRQEHLATIRLFDGLPKFFNSSSGIRGEVVIAVIDSGVDLKHEDLAPNAWVNPREIAGNGRDDDKNGYVDDINGYNFASKKSSGQPEGTSYHGTHVAGLAAARLNNGRGGTGVMGQRVKIMSLNVFGTSKGALSSNIDNAIRYAVNNGADVINMSVGGRGKTPSTEAAIKYAVSRGAVVVVAAGNENRALDETYFLTPASYGSKISGMITVGSIDAKTEIRSRFSNFSPIHVEIGAPGAYDSKTSTGVYSTMLNNGYGRVSGTSMATPVVAGAAALAVGLLKSRGVTPSASLIEQLLIESARDLSSLRGIFKGRVLNVNSLYQVIDKRFPGTGSKSPLPVKAPAPPVFPGAGSPVTSQPAPGQCPA